VEFPVLNSLVRDARIRVQKAQSHETAGHKELARPQWAQVQALMSTINADDHPDWFLKARQEQQAAAARSAPPASQKEALNDIAESCLDLAKADMRLGAAAAARKLALKIDHSYARAQITEPDGEVLPALQAVQQDLPALARQAGRGSRGKVQPGRPRSKTRGRSTSSTRKTS
jgi:hypothetical protein